MSLLQSAGVDSAAVAVSRLTGFARETVLGWLLGAGAIFDAYVLGYRIPNLARDLFAEGALASAFVPAFTRALASENKDEARELSNITATLLLLIVGTLSALGMWLSPWFVETFAPGTRITHWDLFSRSCGTPLSEVCIISVSKSAAFASRSTAAFFGAAPNRATDRQSRTTVRICPTF